MGERDQLAHPLPENEIHPHDLSLPINGARHDLKIVLLNHCDLGEKEIAATRSRIEHFSALTGGVDIAIIFLLAPPPSTLDMNDKADTGPSGLRAYMQLQIELARYPDAASIPLLPLARLDGLADVVSCHVRAMSNASVKEVTGGEEDGKQSVFIAVKDPHFKRGSKL